MSKPESNLKCCNVHLRRRWLAARAGLCSVSLMLMSLIGSSAVSRTAVQAGFTVGALGLGVGTTMMYSNLLAAVADEVAPSWRASALGTCVVCALVVAAYSLLTDSKQQTGCVTDTAFGATVAILLGQ